MPRLARLVAQGVALLLLLLGLLVGPIIFFSALNTFMLLGTSWNGGVFVANGWHGKDQAWPSHCVGSKRLTMLDPIISCNGTNVFVHQSETELWWSCISPGLLVDKEGFGQPSILSSCSIYLLSKSWGDTPRDNHCPLKSQNGELGPWLETYCDIPKKKGWHSQISQLSGQFCWTLIAHEALHMMVNIWETI